MWKNKQELCLPSINKDLFLGSPSICVCPGVMGAAPTTGLYLLCQLIHLFQGGWVAQSRIRQEVPNAAESSVNLTLVLFPTWSSCLSFIGFNLEGEQEPGSESPGPPIVCCRIGAWFGASRSQGRWWEMRLGRWASALGNGAGETHHHIISVPFPTYQISNPSELRNAPSLWETGIQS